MIRPDTTKYRLLEMIGMCGEFPADQLNRLIPSASYAEKLITDLKAEHLIRTHYRDALRGYRLTKAAKEMLLSVSPLRFQCYLTGNTETNLMGDARERFQVGDHILVRILDVRADSPEQVIVHADVKSVEGNTSKENMKKCKIQGKYAGTVEDIHKGTVFVRLSIGVNAIAHSCYDSRTVGKKDQVSFVVTHIDEERNVALGIITRIIKQTI